MALSHVTKEFGVNDAAIYKLSTDVSGTAPTYASKVDIQGVESLECTLATDTKTLRGDNTLLAADSVLKDLTGTINYAKLNFDVLAAATTMTATDSGTTPAQKISMTLSQSDAPVFFKVEAQTKQVDYVSGDVHVVLFKCMPSNIPFGFAEEDYRKQQLGFTSVPIIGTLAALPANSWMQIVANETAVAIV